MSDKRDDGGPAFPVPEDAQHRPAAYMGMALRDWLAGQALSSVFWMWSHHMDSGEVDAEFGHSDFDGVASSAYELADAMIAARSK